MKKGIVLAICLIFLFATCSFAGDIIFAPIIKAPAPGGMDSYVITGDSGTEVVHVFSLDPVAKDGYVIVRDNGESNVVFKMD